MKNFIIYAALLLFLHNNAFVQTLVIKGRVRCQNESPNSTRGAENIIVVPAFIPSKSTITGSTPPGYFECNTGVPFENLQDKQVSLYIVSGCTHCGETTKRVFISKDQDRKNSDKTKTYVTVKDWRFNAGCNDVELPSFRADSMLSVIVKQPGQGPGQITNATALVGTPALLNLLTNITPIIGAVSNAGIFRAKELGPGKIKYGQFLFSSALMQTANAGFNFSPARDMSEAVFWNPSAIVHSRKRYNISLLTNIKNNAKLSGFARLNDRVSLGGGFIYTQQDEYRSALFAKISNEANKVLIDSFLTKLKEYAAFLTPVVKLNEKISAGLTIKSLWQHITIPNLLEIGTDDNGLTKNIYTDSTVKKHKWDIDLSVTYKVNNALQLGLNAMNLAGTSLYADAFAAGANSSYRMQNQRSLGVGLCYKWQRFNFGADVIFTDDGLYDAAFGINYVPFNNALLSAGFTVKQLSYSAAFRIKHFRITYIDDNKLMVNEKRKGKSGILNGRIFGGFVFDF